jgi:hypothetical protein
MKQTILYGAGDLRIEDVPLEASSLQRNQVYVETEVSALCTGTDLGNYLGDSGYVPDAPRYPRWVGAASHAVYACLSDFETRFTTSGINPAQVRQFSQQTTVKIVSP